LFKVSLFFSSSLSIYCPLSLKIESQNRIEWV